MKTFLLVFIGALPFFALADPADCDVPPGFEELCQANSMINLRAAGGLCPARSFIAGLLRAGLAPARFVQRAGAG